MRGGLLPRVLQVVPTLLLVSVLVFLLQQLMPGDPALVMAGENGNDPVLIAQLHAQLGLDRPIVVQYARWLWAALHGRPRHLLAHARGDRLAGGAEAAGDAAALGAWPS